LPAQRALRRRETGSHAGSSPRTGFCRVIHERPNWRAAHQL
jgi:hypothetical protein